MDRIENQILSLLFRGPSSIWRLIDFQDASLPEFFGIMEKMERDGIVRVRDSVVTLTDKGEKIAEEIAFQEYRCPHCDSTGYGIAEEVREDFMKIVEHRPLPVETFDQGYIGTETVLRKLAFILERGDASGSIFVVGDDDLFSIALALTGKPKKVVAVDIDERIINYINEVASEYSLPVEAYIQDVRRENDTFRGKFDVFVTDPVETIPGIRLFLSRAALSLKGVGSSGYFGLTTLEASRRKWYEIQQMLHEMGFVITDIRRRFQVYPDDGRNFFSFQEKLPIVKKLGCRVDYNWYRSALYRIEAVRLPEPLVRGDVEINEEFYKDDESWATPY